MAFVPSLIRHAPVVPRFHGCSWVNQTHFVTNGPQHSTHGKQKRQVTVCLAGEKLPRNGGVNNRVDWSGYDPEELERQVKEAEYMKKHHPVVHTISPWTSVMGIDLIQHKNNIAEASRLHSLPVEWDPSQILIQRMSDITAVREIQNKHETIWQVVVNDEAIAVTLDPAGEGPLCFIQKDEAIRFAEQITADGGGDAKPMEVNTLDVRKECDKKGRLIPFVPSGTLVTPAMLGGV